MGSTREVRYTDRADCCVTDDGVGRTECCIIGQKCFVIARELFYYGWVDPSVESIK